MAAIPVSLIPSFLVYCYVGAITPGPVNLCSLSAALRYGRGPALRQWRGLLCGFTIVSLLSVPAAWLLGVGLFLPFTGPMANLVWLFAGASLQKLFAGRRRAVDTVMAALLALCAVSLVWPAAG